MRRVLSLAAVLAFGLGSVTTLAFAQDAPEKDTQKEKEAPKAAVVHKAVIAGMT